MAQTSTDFTILKSTLKHMLKALRKSASFQCVALRLRQKGDFPYFLHMGFPETFVSKEITLNVKDNEGNLVLEADGTPFVECMCGNVLKRRTNPKHPYFTEEGAFWTNSTTQLLKSLTETEKQEIGRTRNTCHDYGYESVALIPIHANGKTIGLIQINDPREGLFTLETIEKYQSLADHVGTIVINILDFYEEIAQTFNDESELEEV
jgi:transcriptional regulator with GAF, ATPase, and Fis domain